MPSDPGKLRTLTYVPWKPRDRCRIDTLVFVVIVETPRRGQEMHTRLRSYRGNLATRRCKAHFMYVDTLEIPRSGRARHINLCSYRKNLKYVLYLLFVGFSSTGKYLGSVALKTSYLGTFTCCPLNGSGTFHSMRIDTIQNSFRLALLLSLQNSVVEWCQIQSLWARPAIYFVQSGLYSTRIWRSTNSLRLILTKAETPERYPKTEKCICYLHCTMPVISHLFVNSS